jgi:hypothetical protein
MALIGVSERQMVLRKEKSFPLYMSSVMPSPTKTIYQAPLDATNSVLILREQGYQNFVDFKRVCVASYLFLRGLHTD